MGSQSQDSNLRLVISVYYPTLDNIVSDNELRLGPTQGKADKLARLVTTGTILTTINGSSNCNLQDAVNDSMAVVNGEYRLWHKKWQANPTDDRSKQYLCIGSLYT